MTLSDITLSQYIISGTIFICGFILAKALSNRIEASALKHLSAHQAMLIRRLSHGIILLLFLISALQQLGFHFGVLLGAAGVFTVALSFASQTSVANLISGLFLLIERPFKVGDFIQVKSLSGKVHSIDLLSTKIISPDNRLIRLPNESLIKTEIINLNYFDSRRLELLIGISYEANIKQASDAINTIIEAHPHIIKNKPITIDISQLLDSAVELKVTAWLPSKVLRQSKTEILSEILSKFDELNIEIPYPHLTVVKE